MLLLAVPPLDETVDGLAHINRSVQHQVVAAIGHHLQEGTGNGLCTTKQNIFITTQLLHT